MQKVRGWKKKKETERLLLSAMESLSGIEKELSQNMSIEGWGSVASDDISQIRRTRKLLSRHLENINN